MVNPIIIVGRYKIPLLNIAAVTPRSGLRLALSSLIGRAVDRFNVRFNRSMNWHVNRFDVLLYSGHMIKFTSEEKQVYDQELEFHEAVLGVWGMCKSAGLRS